MNEESDKTTEDDEKLSEEEFDKKYVDESDKDEEHDEEINEEIDEDNEEMDAKNLN